jgi:hypothetical protein
MPKFIPISIQDFENNGFSNPSKIDNSKRAFELIKPESGEIYYQSILRETFSGKLVIRVYTSVKSGKQAARGVGEDAIRITAVWLDKDWEAPVFPKSPRVYRSGGEGSTAKDIVDRALNRAREVAKEVIKLPLCPKCNRVLIKRESKTGNIFYGCIGFKKEKCIGSLNCKEIEENFI